jgi:hypothetical protein
MAKRLALGAVAIFLIYFVVTQPAAAAVATKETGSFLVTIASGFSQFFSKVFT